MACVGFARLFSQPGSCSRPDVLALPDGNNLRGSCPSIKNPATNHVQPPHNIPCMTTTALVKGKEGTRMPGSETTREGAGSDVASGPRTSLSALPLQRKVLLLPLLLYFAHDLELAALLNHSLSFHQPCIRSLTTTMIVRANSHPAD